MKRGSYLFGECRDPEIPEISMEPFRKVPPPVGMKDTLPESSQHVWVVDGAGKPIFDAVQYGIVGDFVLARERVIYLDGDGEEPSEVIGTVGDFALAGHSLIYLGGAGEEFSEVIQVFGKGIAIRHQSGIVVEVVDNSVVEVVDDSVVEVGDDSGAAHWLYTRKISMMCVWVEQRPGTTQISRTYT